MLKILVIHLTHFVIPETGGTRYLADIADARVSAPQGCGIQLYYNLIDSRSGPPVYSGHIPSGMTAEGGSSIVRSMISLTEVNASAESFTTKLKASELLSED